MQVYEEERVNVVPCSLVVTEQHLVTCQENLPTSASAGSGDVRILSCAAIQDLTSFTVDSQHRDWCMLVSVLFHSSFNCSNVVSARNTIQIVISKIF